MFSRSRRTISYPEEEIARLKRIEAFYRGQIQLLELLARGASLHSALTHLVQQIEHNNSEIICSVLLFDPITQCLRHEAAPNLPKEFINAFDGIRIGEGVCSCGTAAFRRELVIVEDIESDPLWTDFREIALRHRLRGAGGGFWARHAQEGAA